MNCDQVFDILTRGPFPTGSQHDLAVEIHLTCCPSCHRLAEALRPALELFDETISNEESRQLPGYWTEPTTSAHEIALFCESSARQPAAPRARLKPSLREAASGPQFWRLVAAAVMGAILAVGLRSLSEPQSPLAAGQRGHSNASAGVPESTKREPKSGVRIALLKLKEQMALDCFQPPDRADAASLVGKSIATAEVPPIGEHFMQADKAARAAGSLQLACCVDCHRPGQKTTTREQANMLVLSSCQNCHEQVSARN